ncbi:MAG: diacylglycerol kinase family lipid kinase [Microthrixaceae bacterium]|nr:diacylglycerol kinase family lipid kinase [Microthrixaceae bacterium]
MKVLLIVNAAASSVTPRRQVAVYRLASAAHDVRMVETRHRGHATALAKDAADDGVDVVMVFGGDGTLNEAANGLVGSNVAVAPLPGGSTNVFARTLGLADHPVDALRTTLEALSSKSIHRIGLGSVNGRYFLFHTGVGWDARLVRQVEKRSHLKRRLGHGLFVWAGLETWFGLYDRSRPHFRVEYDDGTSTDDGCFTVVQNSNPYTYVGKRPFNLSPDVTLDGPLCAMTLTALQTSPFLKLMLATLRSRDAMQHSPIVDYHAGVSSLSIDMFRPVPYQVDGDDLGDALRLDFRHHPDALDLVVPLSFSL